MSYWYTENHSKNVRFSIEVEKQLYSGQSPFQSIEVFKSKDLGKVLVIDNSLMLTEKDEQIYHEMIVHVPMAVLPSVQKVLVIGGGDGGALRELVRYPEIQSIDLCEIDQQVVTVSKKYFPKLTVGYKDPRVHTFFEDGLRWVRGKTETYDLIIVDSTDPFGPGESLFTREFYGNCFKALKPDGVVVNQHESPYYKQNARLVRETNARTKQVFPLNRIYQAHIPTYPSGHWLFGFLSKKYDPIKDLDAQRWNQRQLKTFYYNTDLHQGAFALPNYVKRLIDEPVPGSEAEASKTSVEE